MSAIMTFSADFNDGYRQKPQTAMRNLADIGVIEIRKLAPFAKPSQYPHGKYPGTPGTLVKSIVRQGSGMDQEIVSNQPYARRRNNENYLNPQTKFYVERGLANMARGKISQWWRA